jgi:hypothetical protein
MLSANARIAVRHAWESLWYEWPLNLRGLLYYSKNIDDPDKTNTVYLLGACMRGGGWRCGCSPRRGGSRRRGVSGFLAPTASYATPHPPPRTPRPAPSPHAQATRW